MNLEEEVLNLERQIKAFRVVGNRDVSYPTFTPSDPSNGLSTRIATIQQYLQNLTFSGNQLQASGNLRHGFTFENVS